jgi:predicted HTH transcriptional regulator
VYFPEGKNPLCAGGISLMKYYRVVALKELNLTEGKATGFPIIRAEMAKNGSPVPVFYTDDERTLFLVTLPCHPELIWTGIDPLVYY